MKFDEDLRQTIIDLVDTCRINYGVGIAAPQIGVSKKIIVIKPEGILDENISPCSYNTDYMVMINPVIQTDGDKIEWKEACLSVPEVAGKVKRFESCSVVFLDETGETKKIDATWPLAGILQHEIDHLDGILYVDRMEKRKRMGLVWQINRNRRKKHIQAKRKRRNENR